MKSLSTMIREINDVRSNPADIHRVAIRALQSAKDGEYELVDPSNPFVYLLECASAVGAAALERAEALDRRRYAALAQTDEDLYHHMSDADYAERFSRPGKVPLMLVLSLEEVRARAVDMGNGVRKMTIPVHTEITVAGLQLGLYYPIDIRVMSHGSVQVVYDTTVPNPLHLLESNQLNWSITRAPAAFGELAHLQTLNIEIPMYQFRIKDYYDQLNASSGFSKTYAFQDQYYHARVYMSGPNGVWQEMLTTHSDLVYDPYRPTAVLTVLDGLLKVEVPQVYFTQGLLGRTVRVDIYTTQGDVTLALDRYGPDEYSAVWRDLDVPSNPYHTPIRAFSTMTIFSGGGLKGGRDALSFEDLRKRVITNSLNPISIPIVPAQLQAKVESLGYSIVKEVDTITNRVYMATRGLPEPEGVQFSSGVTCTMHTLMASMDDLATLPSVRNNGDRLTIESGTLFKIQLGKISAVDSAALNRLREMTNEALIQELEETQYVYNPFHYVLDASNNQFEARAYYLDKPVVLSKHFVEENQTTQLEVGTMRYAIEKRHYGYALMVITQSADSFRALRDDQVHVQLSFKPAGEIDRAYLNGTLVGRTPAGEFAFQFDLETAFDLDVDDNLQLTSFLMYDESERTVSTPLTSTIDIIYSVSDYDVPGMTTSEVDVHKGAYLLPYDAVGVVQESLNIRFGTSLKGLWTRSRTVVSGNDYERYVQDVMAYYDEDVHERNALTGIKTLRLNQETGKYEFIKLHSAGDPVLDEYGVHKVLHTAGSIKRDASGLPIVRTGRRTMRNVDILLFDGIFAFVTDQTVLDYVQRTTEQIVSWISSDIAEIKKTMLENTELWFYPKQTLGEVDVYVGEALSTKISSDQRFYVRFYLTKAGYENLELREAIQKQALQVINDCLQKTTISVGEMGSLIASAAGSEVLDVTVGGLGGSADYEMLTLKDESARLCIAKQLTIRPDGALSVQDGVVVEFIRHLKV
mgnify:CR=1 FL=1